MNFTFHQIQQILSLIEKNQFIFIGNKLGLHFLTPYQKFVLKQHRIDPNKFKGLSQIDKAYYFGYMAQTLGGLKSFKTTQKQFDAFLKNLNTTENIIQNESLNYVKKRTFTDLSGLGNKIQGRLSNSILTASAAKQSKMADQIKKQSITVIEKQQTAQQLASDLRNITKDWARDFSRIADFIMQEAYGYGRAQQVLDEHGEDVNVYKQTFPGVCDQCEKNYGSPGQKPVIYKLKDLLKNGNNIGRKTQLPVVGNAHPWARSILHVIPEGAKWDNVKKKFVIQRDTKGVKRKNKVKVKIT